ncbi:hypothetical protein LguiA_009523 [Lonicera macranthoides]
MRTRVLEARRIQPQLAWRSASRCSGLPVASFHALDHNSLPLSVISLIALATSLNPYSIAIKDTLVGPLLAPDPALKHFKSHKKGVWRLLRIENILAAGQMLDVVMRSMSKQCCEKKHANSPVKPIMVIIYYVIFSASVF